MALPPRACCLPPVPSVKCGGVADGIAKLGIIVGVSPAALSHCGDRPESRDIIPTSAGVHGQRAMNNAARCQDLTGGAGSLTKAAKASP